MKKILLRLLLAAISMVALLFVYRLAFCPKIVVASRIELPPQTAYALEEKLAGDIVDNVELGEAIKDKKIVLIGETHFQDKVMSYFTDLMGKIPGKKIVLNLELPESIQNTIDAYLETGDEKYLSSIKACSECLPYYNIIKWCRDRKDKVERVFAVDENQSRIFLMRCVCYDTRNKTMAGNILKSYRKYPDRLILFYGGQLHCLLNGRYLYDVENRTPAGKLLLRNGIGRNDLTSILLDYNNNFPASRAWKGSIGAVRINNGLREVPVNFFVRDTLYGVNHAGEVFDYYVNVGNLTGHQ